MPEKGIFGKIKDVVALIKKPSETTFDRSARILSGGITDKDRNDLLGNEYHSLQEFGIEAALRRMQHLHKNWPSAIDTLLVERANEVAKSRLTQLTH